MKWWLIAAAGLLLRLVVGWSGGVYVDEAYTYFLSHSPWHDIIAGSRPDHNPPGYFLLLHPLAILTRSPLLLRLPSLLCASLSLAIIFRLGKRLHGDAAGLGAASLAAFSYACWLNDTQMRAYGLMALLAALLAWQFLDAREGRTPLGGWGLYYGACMVLPLCHYLGAVVNGALLLCACLPGTARRPLMAGAALGLGCNLAWLAYSVSGATSMMRPRPGHFQIPLDFLRAPGYLVGILAALFWPPLQALLQPAMATLEIALNLFLWGTAAHGLTVMARRNAQAATLLAAIFLLPMMALTLGTATGIQSYQHRYLALVAWAFFLPLAVGLVTMRVHSVVVGILVAGNLAVAALYPTHPFYWNQDWQTTARFVEERERPADTVVVYSGFGLIGFDFYYHPSQLDFDYSQSGIIPVRYSANYNGARQLGLYANMLDDDLQKRLAGGRVFLVLNQGTDQAVIEWFWQRYRFSQDSLEQACVNTWGQTRVYVLEPK